MADLRDPRWMLLKALLFVAIGVITAAMLVLENPSLRTAVLLALCVWGFARAYYFAFYVIDKYVARTWGTEFRFAGLFSAARFLATRGRR